MENNNKKTPKVIIYSTPVCPYCIMAKDYLAKRGVEFKDMNVAEDASAAEEMIQKSGQMNVPVIEVDGKIMVGFSPEAIEELIK